MKSLEKNALNTILLWLYLTLIGYFTLTFFRWSDTWKIDFMRPLEIRNPHTDNPIHNQDGSHDLSWSSASWLTNTWSNITILTWNISLTWENETWIVEIPESPRDYLNYLLEHWVAWTDYITAIPPKPPVIYSSNKEENNTIKDAYLARTKITFTLPETDKQGYVLFVADREIPDNRDIFLAINGQTLWAIRKNKSLPVAEYGEYLYPMDKVVIAGGNGKTRNLYDYVKDNELRLNAFVWEKGNYVKKIILFWK